MVIPIMKGCMPFGRAYNGLQSNLKRFNLLNKDIRAPFHVPFWSPPRAWPKCVCCGYLSLSLVLSIRTGIESVRSRRHSEKRVFLVLVFWCSTHGPPLIGDTNCAPCDETQELDLSSGISWTKLKPIRIFINTRAKSFHRTDYLVCSFEPYEICCHF